MKNNIKRYILLSFSILALIATPSFSETIQEGIDLYNSGDYNKAIRVLNTIVKSEPENPEPHLWLSKCYEANFQLDLAMKETRLFRTLKFQADKKKDDSKNIAPTPVPSPNKKSDNGDETKNEDLKIVDPLDRKIVLSDDNFLKEVVESRQPSTVENKKPLDLEDIKPLFSNIPSNKDELLKFAKKLEIKKLRRIASHQDDIMFKKSDLALILDEINEYKEKYSKETNSDKKSFFRTHLGNLIDKYEKRIYELTNLINKSVYTYTDVLSFEYFSHLTVPVDIYLTDMEKIEKELEEFLKDAEENVKNFTSELVLKEKDFEILNGQVNTELLKKDPNDLSPNEKNMVDSYHSLENSIKEIKENIFNYQMESEVLTEALQKLSATVEKVKSGGSANK